MKNFKKPSLLFLSLIGVILISFITLGNAQELKFAYYSQDELKVTDFKVAPALFGLNVKIKKDKIISGVEFYYNISQINLDLKISDGYQMWRAIKSPYNNQWLYLERNLFTNKYNLITFNEISNKRKIVFSENNSPLPGVTFIPFAWSKDKNVVYLEALILDGAQENEGVYSFNIKTTEFKEVPIRDKYMVTPLLSPDRSYFIYGATSDEKRNIVHGQSNILIKYDLITKSEQVIEQVEVGNITLVGWFQGDLKVDNIIPIDVEEESNTSLKIQQLTFKLPWQSGLFYCVSRTGTPAPTGTSGSSYYCGSPWNTYTPHNNSSNNYQATDFDTPNGTLDYVSAVSGGVITTVVNCSGGGYGRYVIITHSDGNQTLYGHLNEIYVNNGETVYQGSIIGDGGNTEVPAQNGYACNPSCTFNSSGLCDHIHFEYRESGVKKYATFSDCGNCYPKQAYRYTSINTANSYIDAPCSPKILSVSTSCSNKTMTNFGATYSSNVPVCSTSTGYTISTSSKDVWFRFTVPQSPGNYTVQLTAGSLTSMGAAIYQGGCSQSGNTLTFINGKCKITSGSIQPKITGTSIPGYWLYVRVWGLSGATGTFKICARNGIYREESETEATLNSGITSEIFPNPTSGIFTINSSSIVNLKVFNSLGQIVYSDEKNVEDNISREIDLRNNPEGIYLLHFTTNEGVINRKIVVKR